LAGRGGKTGQQAGQQEGEMQEAQNHLGGTLRITSLESKEGERDSECGK